MFETLRQSFAQRRFRTQITETHSGKQVLFDMAAAYRVHIAQAQALLDGNKRTGAAAIVFLDANGIKARFFDAPHSVGADYLPSIRFHRTLRT